MKEPRPRGTSIDPGRMGGWAAEFAGYRHSVTESRIDRWLEQFDPSHRDLAARVLDCVDFVPYEQISAAFRSLLNSLPGWSLNETGRQGRWRFVAFSVSAGESGDSMLHHFRIANELADKTYDDLFVHVRDLLRENLGSGDNVVFVDDFAGTGNQVCEAWVKDIAELLPGGPKMYLILVAASNMARQVISQATSLAVAPSFELTESDSIFSERCSHFDIGEKAILLEYCKTADKRQPRGYGACGFVIVFAHRCPNNTIPVLHANHNKWMGLFRRHH